MIALRKRHPALRRRRFLDGGATSSGTASSRTSPTSRRGSRTLALTLDGRRTGREPDRDFYMAFNAWQEPLPFAVPPAPQGKPWRRVIDTALASPLDIVGPDEGPDVPAGSSYTVAPHSVLVLISDL